MKQLLVSLLLLLMTTSVLSKSETVEQETKRVNGKLCLVYNGETFAVNSHVLTVQKKTSEQVLNKNLKQVRGDRYNFVHIEVPEGVDIEEYAQTLKSTGEFETVEYIGECKTCMTLTPNDEYYPNQWYADAIGLPKAWRTTTGSPNIKLAIIDTGVDAGHPDLGYGSDSFTNVSTTEGWNYTTNSAYSTPVYEHGTIVAGIAASKINNSIGIAGIAGGDGAPGVTILPFCIGNASSFDGVYLPDAINDAVENGANIINLSIMTNPTSEVTNALYNAYKKGVVVVCASGNGNAPVAYPANLTNSIAVGAIDTTYTRRESSNYGYDLDFVAPGQHVCGPVLNGGYKFDANGTSLSAPIVSGIVALMLSVNPSLDIFQVRDILNKTCTKLDGYTFNEGGWNVEVGMGLVNAGAAVEGCKPWIEGNDVPCGKNNYYVAYQTGGTSVTWSWQTPSSDNPTIIQNSPYKDGCTFTKENHDYFDNTLLAKLSVNGDTIKTLKKRICSGANFSGTYSQAAKQFSNWYYAGIDSEPFYSGNTIQVLSGTDITIQSDYLNGALLVYTGKEPSVKTHSGNTLTLRYTSSLHTAQIPFTTTITGSRNACEIYRFNVKVYSPMQNIVSLEECIAMGDSLALVSEGAEIPENYTLSISASGQNSTFTIDVATLADGAVESSSGTAEEWNLTVANIMTGKTVCEEHVSGASQTVDTSSWESGVYVARAVVQDYAVAQKLVITK